VTGEVPFNLSGATDVWGIAVGGGVEWAFLNSRWTLKAEYEYLGLQKSVLACGTFPPPAVGAGGLWCTQGGINGIQTGKVGLNYRLN
jgi:opacity protein-like surface antigen